MSEVIFADSAKEDFDLLVEEIKSHKICLDEVLRQKDIRFKSHIRYWGIEPFIKCVVLSDVAKARAYLNTVEHWDDFDREYWEDK